jgi:hypothetical protein
MVLKELVNGGKPITDTKQPSVTVDLCFESSKEQETTTE